VGNKRAEEHTIAEARFEKQHSRSKQFYKSSMESQKHSRIFAKEV
jgi:hypothetical protein